MQYNSVCMLMSSPALLRYIYLILQHRARETTLNWIVYFLHIYRKNHRCHTMNAECWMLNTKQSKGVKERACERLTSRLLSTGQSLTQSVKCNTGDIEKKIILLSIYVYMYMYEHVSDNSCRVFFNFTFI